VQAADQIVKPNRAGVVLTTLILVAGVANINLAVANVAKPDIGKAFTASQTAIDLIAVGFSLGLAASVLYFGAIGDRYGRKLLLVLGVALSIPASLVASYAPSAGVLIAARLVGGLAAGMSYPGPRSMAPPAAGLSGQLRPGIGSGMRPRGKDEMLVNYRARRMPRAVSHAFAGDTPHCG
jgi:MFS family permease